MRVKKQVIRQHHPARDLLIALVGVTVIGACAYALYDYATGWAQDELSGLYKERDELTAFILKSRISSGALMQKWLIRFFCPELSQFGDLTGFPQ